MLFLSKEEASYIAAFLDGEGCFTISSSITIKVACTYKPTLDWLSTKVGGNIRDHDDISNKKKSWVWSIHAGTAVNLIEQILPFLKEKSSQALILLEYQETIKKRGSKISKEVQEERLLLRKELKSCKSVW